MSAELDELYFTWLYEQVEHSKSSSKSHVSLARQLFQKEFLWTVHNDENRIVDGQDLRYEFLETVDVPDVDSAWLGLGCSMLEMLIALSRRLSFLAEDTPKHWFWVLMNNLGFREFYDRVYTNDVTKFVDQALDTVIWRKYQPSGYGGLFPLNYADRDQRKVEIWYQLNAYLLEIPEM